MSMQIIEIRETDIFLRAQKRFIEICGFEKEQDLPASMRQAGFCVREKQFAKTAFYASVFFTEEISLAGERLTVCGEEISCRRFEKVPSASVKGAFFFLLSAGEEGAWDDPMEALYADIWGTAYAEAAAGRLREILIEQDPSLREEKAFLSPLFGPGYYGMPVTALETFYRLAEGSAIGVTLTESGILLPQKSCTGLFLIMKEQPGEIPSGCKSCSGAGGGCGFCGIGK